MERVLAGRYKLEVPLGRGGSGEVWRGRDMASHRPVAIKVVELSQIDDPGLLAETIGRFRREATVVSGLHHPNIVGSLDAGRVGNQLFMIMDLAPGVSLASMMDERGARGMGLFPVSSVLLIATGVASGLVAAHQAGVVHRDIKPSNLMVTPQLGLQIIDFGIARLLADNSPRLTMRGHTVGTVAYMSPEQAQGDEVDGRADLYSLGCVLYQLLSGRLPFRSPLPSALLMMQVMDQAIPLSALRSDLPPAVTKLVSDLMEKDRAARPADAAEVIRRIGDIDTGELAGEPHHEADSPAFGPGDLGGTPPETRAELVLPEPGRERPVPGDRRGAPPGRETIAVAPWQLPAEETRQLRDPRANLLPAADYGGGPPGRASGALPGWPAPPPRRRRRWRGVLASVLTLAIAAGVWAYVWERSHAKLSITSVSVRAANEIVAVGCNGTASILATISTNGRGGQITYEWITDSSQKPQVLTAQNRSGSGSVQVSLKWKFHGHGTGSAVATLEVLSPETVKDSIKFPYSCTP
jgi:Protein kinase domain